MDPTTTLAAIGGAFSILGFGFSYGQQKLAFELEQELAALSVEGERLNRQFRRRQRHYNVEELGGTRRTQVGTKTVSEKVLNPKWKDAYRDARVIPRSSEEGDRYAEVMPRSAEEDPRPDVPKWITVDKEVPIYEEETVKGRRQEELEARHDFGKRELAAQERLLEFRERGARIQSALKQNQLKTASREAGQRARIQASNLKFAQGALGRSAALRASVASSISLMAPVEDQLQVARTLGAITEQRFQTEFGRLSDKREQFEGDFNRALERLEAEREFAAEKFDFDLQQSQLREEALQKKQDTARRQANTNPISNLVDAITDIG